MRDLSHIIGDSPGAGPEAGRRLAARRRRRWHPDFDAEPAPAGPTPPDSGDAAVDFVDMTTVVDRIHASFVRSHA